MTIPAATLRITDGVTAIDLISPDRGWHLSDWQPSYPGQDVGYRQSPMADGRVPVTRRYDYPIEQMTYVLDADNPDLFIATRRKLDKMLKQALDYWKDDWRTTSSGSPIVWLEARGTYETDTRYAPVISGQIGPYPYPYGAPMVPDTGPSVQAGITLSIEHQFWQDEVPGSSHCIEINSLEYGIVPLSVEPTEQDDDCYVDTAGAGAITLNSAGIRFGEAAASMYHAGVRFRAVTIPQGSVIHAAYIRYSAENALAANTVTIRLYGHDADNAAIFSTYADFMARVLTTAYSEVAAWGAHVAGTVYQTVDVTAVVQEIISRAGWASGNALAIILQNQAGTTAAAYRDMSSFDSANPEPELHIVYKAATATKGRAATCDSAAVYAASKYNDADVTHIFNYDTSVAGWSANLKVAALPYDLYPGAAAGPDNGDIVYFGSECVATNPRPFTSLVFCVGTAATYGAGDLVTWEYWNGAAWVGLSVTDMTMSPVGGGLTSKPWMYVSAAATDSQGLFWAPPTAWAATTVNGITGFWVRGVVTEAAAITRATQQTRQVYSVTTSFVDADENTAAGALQLRGDLPMSLVLATQGAQYDAGYSTGSIRRVMIGARRVSRGTGFRAYVNADGRQNGVGVVAASPGLVANNLAATGMVANYTSAAAISPFTAVFLLYLPLADYKGRYHLFLRYACVAGTTGDMRARVGVQVYGATTVGASTTSVPVVVDATDLQIADMGRIELPPHGLVASYTNEYVLLTVEVAVTLAAVRTIGLADIVLVPCDEWLGDFRDEQGVGDLYPKRGLQHLSIQGIKGDQAARLVSTVTGSQALQGTWVDYQAQPISLEPNVEQRFWYLLLPEASGTDVRTHLVSFAELDGAALYLNMRGND